MWLTGIVVITLETSALGTYVLHGHGNGAYRLGESRRAEIDAAGFRRPSVSRERHAGVSRVAFLGDSTTYGWLVPERDAYPRRVERVLTACGAHPLEVINAGVPGYDVPRMTDLLATHVAAWQPDVVVVMSGPNDREITPGEFRASLERLLAIAAALGERVVLATYPFGAVDEAGAKNSVIEALARERGVPLVDAQAVADGMPHRAFFLLDGEHPTPIGHEALATAIAPVVAGALWPDAAPARDCSMRIH